MSSYAALLRCLAAGCAAPIAVLALGDEDRLRCEATFGTDATPGSPVNVAGIAREVAYEPVHGADAAGVGVIAIGRDEPPFTPEQRTVLRDFAQIASSIIESEREHALRRLMSRAVEEAFDFVLLTDASAPSGGGPYIEYANASLLHALQYTSDELLGKPYGAVFADTNDPATLASIARNLESARDNEKEVQLLRADGTSFWAEFTVRPLLDAQGAPSHWFAVGRDISSNRETLTQIAALINALDTVADHVEIYTFDGTQYVLAFQNGSCHPAVSENVAQLLGDPTVRARLQAGETLRMHGVMLRPIAGGDTVICVRRQPARFAKAS